MAERAHPALPRGTRILPERFFLRPTPVVARALLGAVLARITPAGLISGRIVETEAYHEDGDEASHSFRGRTERNAVMFGAPRHLYVYFTYGMHHCMNIVTERRGIGAAVLIRAVEPLEGIAIMHAHRGEAVPARDLARGPARCCAAFGIDRRLNGAPLCGPELFVLAGAPVADEDVIAGPRIGITRAQHLDWRFVIRGCRHVSGATPR